MGNVKAKKRSIPPKAKEQLLKKVEKAKPAAKAKKRTASGKQKIRINLSGNENNRIVAALAGTSFRNRKKMIGILRKTPFHPIEISKASVLRIKKVRSMHSI
jgi:hypothetical protein